MSILFLNIFLFSPTIKQISSVIQPEVLDMLKENNSL